MAGRSFRFPVLAVCLLLAAAAGLGAQPPDRARTEALAQRATDRLIALQREADRLASEERTLLGELRKLEIERQLKAEEVRQLDAEAARVQADLDAKTARMRALQAADAAERPALKARLVETYKLGSARYLRLLLSTPDLRRIGQATRTVAALAKLDRDRVLAHQRTLAELKTAADALQDRAKQLAGLRADAAAAQAAADRAARERNDLVRDIDTRRDLNAQLSGELHDAQQKLQAAVSGAASVEPAGALPLRPFRGELDWPVAGPVRVRFGRQGTISPNGIELGADEGAAAVAVHEGTVAYAGNFSGFGNLVIVDHGSRSFSLYAELLELKVRKGDRVAHGQPVGFVGPTRSGAAGLYFELRVDGQAVDPLQWLKKR